MPIIGLTDERSFDLNRAMPRIGKLYKGSPKQERQKNGRTYEIFGKDLDYFRAEFEPEFEDLADQFTALYGEQPAEFPEIQFIADDVNKAFETWHEEYDAAQTLLHRCDGEVQHVHYNKESGIHATAKIACRANTGEGCGQCNMVGRLRVVLVDFAYETGAYGYFQIETHSKNDIINLYNGLRLMHQRYRALVGIPFVLGRSEREISTPMTDKKTGEIKRSKTRKSLLYIRPVATFVKEVMLKAPIPTQALPAPQLQLVEPKRRIGDVPVSSTNDTEPEVIEDDKVIEPNGEIVDVPQLALGEEKVTGRIPEHAMTERRGKVFKALAGVMTPDEIVARATELDVDWYNPKKGYSSEIVTMLQSEIEGASDDPLPEASGQ